MLDKLKNTFKLLVLIAAVIAAGVVSALVVMRLGMQVKEDVKTPAIEGNEVVMALEKINQARLNLKITSLAYDAERPRNTIVSQDPKAGTAIKEGRDVRVIISRGPREFDMPALIGLTWRQAANMLAERGLTIGASYKIHAAADEGEIVAQYPSAGSHVTDLDQVETLVSAGRLAEIELAPDVTGMQLEAAKRELQKAGFRAGTITFLESAEGAGGAVIAQNPAAGTPADAGSEVPLTVVRRPKDPEKPGTYTLYTMVLPANVPAGTVKVLQETKTGQKEIYNRAHKGGDTVSALVEIGGPTTVRLYMNDQLLEVKPFAP
ncbi:MAG: PASTA domain-containing protein [Nitrospinae bacterium]|nr:PASTA domain-containing protein [Nitrospinota bacterium]